MKKILLFLAITLFCNISNAQFDNYKHSYKHEPYANLVKPIYILTDTFWVDSSYKNLDFFFSPPFKFQFRGSQLKEFYLNFGTSSIRTNDRTYQLNVPFILSWLMEPNLQAPYLSKVSVDFTWMNGEYILKFEMRDVGLADSSYTLKGIMNMQIWFYEKGAIELRYGNIIAPQEVINKKYYGYFKPCLKVTNMDTFNFHQYYLSGPFAQPRGNKGKNTAFANLMKDSALSQIPPSGTVYRFEPIISGIAQQIPFSTFKIYPNPFKERLFIDGIESENSEIEIMDLNSRTVLKQNISKQNTSKMDINTENIPAGFYIISIKAGESAVFKKIWKQ